MDENFRKIALGALLAFFQKGTLLEESFKKLPAEERSVRQAKELAMGVLRHSILLGELLSSPKLKLPCLLLAKMALYQHLWMDAMPIYAIVNETVEMAKAYSPVQAKFLNSLLRKMSSFPPLESIRAEPIRYSIPPFLYDRLKASLPKNRGPILEALTMRPKYMIRSKEPLDLPKLEHEIYLFKEGQLPLAHYLKVPGVYVQNSTPIRLMRALYREDFHPKEILDVCAAPGGKITLARDFFPSALLHANDVSSARVKVLKSNLERLKIEAKITEMDARALPEHLYDLIILDVPCSNTGVIHKKPEAKYRLSAEELERLVTLSKELLTKAKEMLAQGGEIWLLTCSLLREENEDMVLFAKSLGLRERAMLTLYPDKEGSDGGFGAALVEV